MTFGLDVISFKEVARIIDSEINFLAKSGVKHQSMVMSAHERIKCLENIKEQIMSRMEE